MNITNDNLKSNGKIIHKSRLCALRKKKWADARRYITDMGGWVLYQFNNLYDIQGVDESGRECLYVLHTEWEGRVKLLKLNGVCV